MISPWRNRRTLAGLAVLSMALPLGIPGLGLLAWGLDAGSFRAGWPGAEGWVLLLRSAALALATALSAFLLGLPAALRVITARSWRMPLLLATLLVPPAIHGLGWASVASELAQVTRRLGGSDPVFQGALAAAWVNTMAFAPLATALSTGVFLCVDPSLLESARVFQPEGRALRRVLLPLGAPALALGAFLLFVLALQDFTIPALFSVPTYTMGLFSRFSADRNPSAMLAQAVPLALAALPLVLLAGRTWQGLAGHRTGGPMRPLGGLHLRSRFGARWGDAWILLPALSPVLLVLLAFDGRRWAEALQRAWPDLGYSLALAATTAALAVPGGALLAWGLRQLSKAWTLLAAPLLLPLILPSVLPAIGILKVFQHLPVAWEGLAPLLAMLARTLPLGALLFLGAWQRLDPDLLDAARVLGRRPWVRWARVHGPLFAPAAATAAVAAFTLTLGECAGLLLVLPPGRSTLATRLFNLLHYGSGPDVAALSTLLSLLSGGVAACALLAVRHTTHWRSRR